MYAFIVLFKTSNTQKFTNKINRDICNIPNKNVGWSI